MISSACLYTGIPSRGQSLVSILVIISAIIITLWPRQSLLHTTHDPMMEQGTEKLIMMIRLYSLGDCFNGSLWQPHFAASVAGMYENYIKIHKTINKYNFDHWYLYSIFFLIRNFLQAPFTSLVIHWWNKICECMSYWDSCIYKGNQSYKFQEH